MDCLRCVGPPEEATGTVDQNGQSPRVRGDAALPLGIRDVHLERFVG